MNLLLQYAVIGRLKPFVFLLITKIVLAIKEQPTVSNDSQVLFSCSLHW